MWAHTVYVVMYRSSIFASVIHNQGQFIHQGMFGNMQIQFWLSQLQGRCATDFYQVEVRQFPTRCCLNNYNTYATIYNKEFSSAEQNPSNTEFEKHWYGVVCVGVCEGDFYMDIIKLAQYTAINNHFCDVTIHVINKTRGDLLTFLCIIGIQHTHKIFIILV